ncbi:MAG: hypothetical protein JXQ96_08600 [Cyclobacteriaceae bacterium]
MTTTKTLLLLLLISGIASLSWLTENESINYRGEKINGVCFVAPRHEVRPEHLAPIKGVNANWIAVTPYAFSRPGEPGVHYNNERQWRGEKVKGCIETIQGAKSLGLKIMLKPHIWVRGQGWAGEFDLPTDDLWKQWESNYSEYILTYAKIADSLNVDMLCIGTEIKLAIQKRPGYWTELIPEIRRHYKGKLTYAANWDNYDKVKFWHQLDYIGVDSYFPICEEKTPEVATLVNNWGDTKSSLSKFSKKHQKPILFTEFGYRSMDYTAAGHWEMDRQEAVLNMEGQKNALEALFKTYWNEEWFGGGFLWKWHSNHKNRGGIEDSRYTPQNKPAEQLVKNWYGNQR